LSSIATDGASRLKDRHAGVDVLRSSQMSDADLREVLRLCSGTAVQAADGGVVLQGPHDALQLGRLPASLRVVLDRLAHGGGTGRELLALHRATSEHAKPTEVIAFLGRLARGDRLCRTLEHHGAPLLTARSPDASRGHWATSPEPTTVLQLSRFVRLYREGRELWLESPLALAKVVLHDRRIAALLHDLGPPTAVSELLERGELPAAVVGAALGMLVVGGLVCRVPPLGASEEDVEPARGALWDPVELLAHHHARSDPSGPPLGKTHPFVDRFDPLPVLAPPRGRSGVELPRLDLEALRRSDPPLVEVMESRRSLRRHGVEPITLEALGELLYRTLRVRTLEPAAGRTHAGRSDRPYPSAGACHPLEAYVAVDRCSGLAPGLHCYDPQHHALHRVEPPAQAPADALEGLLDDAMHASGAAARPQVLLVLTARFGRSAWVYGRLSHRLVLQEVGVAFQSLYLAATAMGLAACALGRGSASRFATLTGLDPRVEASVGEMMLGSRPSEPA
jgi:oxazoline/thiazoline dehydrogenase